MFLSSMDRRYTLLATSGKILVEMKKAEPCSIGLFNLSISQSEKNTWLLSYRCTQETRPRVLQWKILYNIYVANILLFKDESEG